MEMSNLSLNRTLSNHFPIVLNHSVIKWGSSLFKINNKWFKVDIFKVMVESAWNNTIYKGTPSFRLVIKKLKEKYENLG